MKSLSYTYLKQESIHQILELIMIRSLDSPWQSVCALLFYSVCFGFRIYLLREEK